MFQRSAYIVVRLFFIWAAVVFPIKWAWGIAVHGVASGAIEQGMVSHTMSLRTASLLAACLIWLLGVGITFARYYDKPLGAVLEPRNYPDTRPAGTPGELTTD